MSSQSIPVGNCALTRAFDETCRQLSNIEEADRGLHRSYVLSSWAIGHDIVHGLLCSVHVNSTSELRMGDVVVKSFAALPELSHRLRCQPTETVSSR